MAKVILVMDMPESCRKCRLHEMSGDFDKILCVPIQKSLDKFSNDIPVWCPLKLLPEKKDVDVFSDSVFPHLGWKALGWNACLDEILNQ